MHAWKLIPLGPTNWALLPQRLEETFKRQFSTLTKSLSKLMENLFVFVHMGPSRCHLSALYPIERLSSQVDYSKVGLSETIVTKSP